MDIAVIIAVVVLLTAITLLVSRGRADSHQEDLNDHGPEDAPGRARVVDEGRPDQPKSDRPAGPDAEAMGVSDAGQPSVDPTAERRD